MALQRSAGNSIWGDLPGKLAILAPTAPVGYEAHPDSPRPGVNQNSNPAREVSFRCLGRADSTNFLALEVESHQRGSVKFSESSTQAVIKGIPASVWARCLKASA